MVQDAVPGYPLGRAGDLSPLHKNVVAAGGLRIQAQGLQGLHDGAGEPLHGQLLRIAQVGDEGIIQIPQIVIHRAASGGPAHHMDAVLLHEGPVDLRLRVLILANDDGVVVLPQQQIGTLPAMGQYIFLKG